MPDNNPAAAQPGTAAPPPHAAAHHHAAPLHSVTYTGHTKLIFLWPVILLGYLFVPLSNWGDKGTLGWIYVITMVICILAVAVDLNRNYGLVWLLLIALIVVVGK